jgi:hypothetical protein
MYIDPTIIIGIITFIGAFLGSMLGLGGGFLIVPLLVIFAGLSIKVATPLSLLSIVGTSTSATIVYANREVVNFKVGLILETATILGAIIGANTNLMIDETTLTIAFVIVIIYVSYRMLKNRGEENRDIENNKREIKYSKMAYTQALTASFLAGFLSALLGIGGGIIKIPVLTLLLSIPMREAIGTSLFMISVTSVSGVYIYFSKRVIDLIYGGYAVIGAFIGAQIGSRLSLKIKADILRKVFSIILIIFSIIMILRVLGVWI